jgi:TonB family protein
MRFAEGDFEGALQAFRRVGERPAPPDVAQEARLWEGEALVQLRRYDEARRAWEAAAADRSSALAPQALYRLGWLHLELRRPEAAVRSFRALLEGWPGHPIEADATFGMGRALTELSRYTEAAPFLAAFTTRYPAHERAPEARELLGLAARRTAEASVRGEDRTPVARDAAAAPQDPAPAEDPVAPPEPRSEDDRLESVPIPIDSTDPRFSHYVGELRRRIAARWRYPREAARRNIQGQLEVEFAVAKDGRLQHVTVRRSSGVEMLDRHAVMAIEAAAPFPAVPDQVSSVGIPVVAVFTYAIEAGR